MQFYPSYLPSPQQRGFNYKIKPNIIRTQMADGHVRQRLVNTGTPHELSVTFIFSDEEYRKFMAWYRKDINYGQDWFYMPVLNEYGSTDSLCRIQKGELSASLNCVNNNGPLWSVQCRLDVEPGIGGDEVWIEPDGWDELYAYIWVPYTVTHDWPGMKLKKNRLGYYVLNVKMLTGYYYDCTVEFHDNKGKSTWSIYFYDFDEWRGRIIRAIPDGGDVEYVSWFN